MIIILVPHRPRQKDYRFDTSLNYRGRHCHSKKIRSAEQWWCMPLIPALRKQRQVNLWVKKDYDYNLAMYE